MQSFGAGYGQDYGGPMGPGGGLPGRGPIGPGGGRGRTGGGGRPGGRGGGPGGGRGRGCRFEGRFREHGLKLTVPRRVIIDILDNEEEYLTAEDVYMKVYETHPNIGLATVYRTLQLLEEISLVHRLETGDGKSRFKLFGEKDRHERLVFICAGCGRTKVVDELTDEERGALDLMEKRGRAEESFRSVQRTVQFYGYCTGCSE